MNRRKELRGEQMQTEGEQEGNESKNRDEHPAVTVGQDNVVSTFFL